MKMQHLYVSWKSKPPLEGINVYRVNGDIEYDGLSLKCVGKRQLIMIQMIPKNYRYGLEIVDTDRLDMVS